MQVRFYNPHPKLKEYVLMYSHAILTVEELRNTKFLPDNNTSLTLFLNKDYAVKDYFSENIVNHRITFTGQYSIPVLYTPNEDIHIINIDFFPWGAYSVFGKEQSSIHNITSHAVDLFPDLSLLIPDLENHLDDVEYCIEVLENFLLAELQKQTKHADDRIIEACKIITSHSGNLKIKDLCKTVGMSQTGFTNCFSETIGVTPKLFGRVARFTAVQNFLGKNPKSDWRDILHKFDYFDQNHFIREFKHFTGAIPKDRRQWEALFDPLKKAVDEGFVNDEEQMKKYRDAALYQILHCLPIKKKA
ncbi:helix-turn-helix domain-containing protein [Pseudopedobacter beijingensis]|uniref:Helix-turn-helix domain-containing protein n=1 Tax=Pseudopedobacter beijingensis TaxID=1207056 RepID=A0ABW4IDE7_9SPHI